MTRDPNFTPVHEEEIKRLQARIKSGHDQEQLLIEEIHRLRAALKEARQTINDYGLDDFEMTTHEALAKIDAALEK